MEKDFWSVDEVCQYLNIKRSTAYSLVESGTIPFYRIGRLLRFKPEDVKGWMETRRSESIHANERAKDILKAINKPRMDVDSLVKKSIAEAKGNRYTPLYGKPDRNKGLGKGVSDGTLS